MSRLAKRSPSKNPRGSRAGAALGRVVVGTAVVMATAGALLRPARIEQGGFLLTVARSASGSPTELGGPPRFWIARIKEDGGKLRILSGNFWSASSPSLSYDGQRCLFVGRRARTDAPQIWEMRIDGTGARRITRGQGDPAGPTYLPDGRILYSDRPAAGGEAPADGRSLHSCAADGSDPQRLTFGRHRDTHPRVLPDGRIRFERHLLPSGGPSSPLELTIHPDGTGVARFIGPPGTGTPTGPVAAVRLPGRYRLVDRERIAARPVPPILTSVVRKERPTGTLLCLNVYASRIPAVASLPSGSIARVRVGAAGPLSKVGAGIGPGSPPTEAPVQPDGSFFIEVPADTPLRLSLLAADGRAIATLESGLWVRPNENRGCIGCHEEPDLAPENRQPLAVRLSAVPLLWPSRRIGGSDVR